MQYKTEQYILQVIKQAVQQEVEIIKDDYESLKEVSRTLATLTKELNQAKKENEALRDVYKNSRELIKRLESKFDTIEPISHSESHADEYGNGGGFYEEGYKVTTDGKDEIFILEHGSL